VVTGGQPAAQRIPGGSTDPARQQSLRRHNLALVLAHILSGGPAPSRADIAGQVGLTRTTVSALVEDLVQARLVTELPALRSRTAGRPAVPLVPAAGTLAAVGIEINVDFLGVRVLDLAGEVLAEKVLAGDHRSSDPDRVLRSVATLVTTVLGRLDGDIPVAGACVALPGLVDSPAGPLRLAPHLHWSGVDVAGRLATVRALRGVPVRLANEATLAAQAEAARRGPESFLYVSGEVGIGGALVRDGRVRLGDHGWAGEIGHLTVDPRGPECDCRATGCLEVFAGQDALRRAAGWELDRPVAELSTAGGPAVVEALRQAGEALGIALAGAVNLLDVQQIVLGGCFAPLAAELVPAIDAELRRRVLSAAWAPVQVQAAVVGDYPALTGAATAVIDAVAADPASWSARIA
jgi:predicted NBD/HSP70 family sugar kinase